MTTIKHPVTMSDIFSQHIKARNTVKALDKEMTKTKKRLKKVNLNVENARNPAQKLKAEKQAKTMRSNFKDAKQNLSVAKNQLRQYEKVTEDMVNFLVAKCEAIEEFSNKYDEKHRPKLSL